MSGSPSYTNDYVLLLSNSIFGSSFGGRELLCNSNYICLRSILGDRLIVHELQANAIRGFWQRLAAFRGHIDGLNNASVALVIQKIRSLGVRQVFVDGSNLGEFVCQLKRQMPTVEIITFFHNVESRFFWGALRSSPSLRSFAVFLANVLAERKSVKYSDTIICLSHRDSNLLKKLFSRGATHVFPIVLEDKSDFPSSTFSNYSLEHFVLFVGGSFYANRQGIRWFVREVTPFIDNKLFIVGAGFEDMRAELEHTGKVTVVGSVTSVSDWYRRAQFVIAPIFDGSGMKTKVAEALMYGKKIVGTPEAFSGYEDVLDQVGWVCQTSEDFVAAIQVASAEISISFDISMRLLYEQHYSLTAAKNRLRRVFL